jgi:hypothetical protein
MRAADAAADGSVRRRLELIELRRMRAAGPPQQAYRVGERPVTHWMSSANDDRPHIVTTLSEQELLRREWVAGAGFLLLFVVAGFALLVALAQALGAL